MIGEDGVDSNLKLMTLAEAAKQSACSTKTLRRAIDAGHLVACRLGSSAKSDRIHAADLADWWERSKIKPAAAIALPPPRLVMPDLDVDRRLAQLLGLDENGRKKTAPKRR